MTSLLKPPAEGTAAEAIEYQIGAHPFLKGFQREHLRALSDNALLVRFAAGQNIFEEDEPANGFYLIAEGRILIESSPRERDPIAIQFLGRGDVLGWSWLFPPYYWHFSARAIEPTEAVFLYGPRLRQLCEADHDLAFELFKRVTLVVIQRLQVTRSQLLAAEAKA